MTSSKTPFITVIIPTYRRPEPLARCLQALAGQNYPPDRFSVIVVDDGSPVPVCDELLGAVHGRLPVEILRQPQGGPASARNQGARRAEGELLAFTDDDCTPDPGWLRALAEAHAESPEAALGGATQNALSGNPFSAASQLLIEYFYDYFERHPTAGRFFTSNNLALPAHAFRELGGFSADFPLAAGEDRDFCDRWIARGGPVRYVPAAEVGHHHTLTLKGFLRQHFAYGRGGLQLQQARARRGATTQFEPPAFYLNLLLYPLKRLGPAQGLPATLLFVLAQAANATGFFWERWRSARAPRSTGQV